MRRFTGLLCLLFASALTAAGQRAGAKEGAQLLYTSVRDGKARLFLIQADSGEERQLTAEEASLGAWSPDGKQIAFTSARSGNHDLFVMEADGSRVRQLTRTDPDRENQVAWSPDGKRLVFHRHTDTPLSDEIFLMNSDGTGEINLSNNPAFDGDPAWSPDGKQILFVSTRNGAFQLFLMDPSGGNVQPLPVTADGWVFPAWSPDGKAIAYTKREGGGLELCTCRADGSDPQKLTGLGGSNTFAAWSPDGGQIVFEHYPNDTAPGELWITSADGRSLRRLGTTGPPLAGRPAWKPR